MKKHSLLGKLFSGSTRDPSAEGDSADRRYVAEQLESRILYSAVPLDVGFPEATAEEAPAEFIADAPEGVGIQSLEGFGGDPAILSGRSEIVIDEMVSLLSFDDLSTEELEQITNTAIERWKDSRLSEQEQEESAGVDLSMIDLEGSSLGYAEGSHVFLDSEAADIRWKVDSTPLDEVELFMDEEGLLDAINRVVIR